MRSETIQHLVKAGKIIYRHDRIRDKIVSALYTRQNSSLAYVACVRTKELITRRQFSANRYLPAWLGVRSSSSSAELDRHYPAASQSYLRSCWEMCHCSGGNWRQEVQTVCRKMRRQRDSFDSIGVWILWRFLRRWRRHRISTSCLTRWPGRSKQKLRTNKVFRKLKRTATRQEPKKERALTTTIQIKS